MEVRQGGAPIRVVIRLRAGRPPVCILCDFKDEFAHGDSPQLVFVLDI
jgi:hypothetical protein